MFKIQSPPKPILTMPTTGVLTMAKPGVTMGLPTNLLTTTWTIGG